MSALQTCPFKDFAYGKPEFHGMPVTRGGTISAAAENKHKGWYPVFLFNRLRSQGSVSPKHLPCHLVNGELEMNPEGWVWDLAQPLRSSFVPSQDFTPLVMALWFPFSKTQDSPLFEPLITGLSLLRCNDRLSEAHCFCIHWHHPALASSILSFPMGRHPPPSSLGRLGLFPPRHQGGRGPTCNFCFRKQLTTSLKRRTGRIKCKSAS